MQLVCNTSVEWWTFCLSFSIRSYILSFYCPAHIPYLTLCLDVTPYHILSNNDNFDWLSSCSSLDGCFSYTSNRCTELDVLLVYTTLCRARVTEGVSALEPEFSKWDQLLLIFIVGPAMLHQTTVNRVGHIISHV